MRSILLLANDEDGEAIWPWLDGLADTSAARLSTGSQLADHAADVLWVHGEAARPADLLPWLQRGGRLLATLGAARIPHELGLETIAPDDRRLAVWRHQEDEFWLPEFKSFQAFPHIRGLAGFGAHPLFAGIGQGTFTWAPADGEQYEWTTYRERRPAEGAIVAVERSFIHLNPGRVVAWEYETGDGGILCIGAFIYPAAPDLLLQRQLHALLTNALRGDAIPHRDRAVPVALWPPDARRVIHDPGVPVPRIEGVDGSWSDSTSSIESRGEAREDVPWTFAGRRMLLTGTEQAGLREAWSHPFRMMRDVSLQVDGEPVRASSITVLPDQVILTTESAHAHVAERWTTALERPILIWEVAAPGNHGITLQWTIDLRRMWPYPAGNYGDLRWNLNDAGDHLWVGASGAPVQALFRLVSGRFRRIEGLADPVRIQVEAEGQGSVRLVGVAAVDSADLAGSLRAVERKRLEGIQRQRRQHGEQIITYQVALETPEVELTKAFEWAKVRTDSFVAETPGLGRSLLAGYATSRTGWGDGRPGYAWYFGRDACWTAFGMLAAGNREGTRDVLRFLADTQDVSGKILHEYTTSGLVHYDAADSTRLFLLLVARYARWTGDLEFIRKQWDAIHRAYEFCLETDRDDDGLIENARVGHGWIEHGPLGGASVTLYLAACWLAALEGLEPVADALGKAALADELRDRAVRARSSIQSRFRHHGNFALGLDADGSPMMHRTAMLAVPVLLGAVHGDDVTSWLDAVRSPDFTTPWGVRMISAADPCFDPAGYHLGSVWPLYTGWVSLAEFRAGRFDDGLDHLLMNARLAEYRARGAFPEVLHGENGSDAGICADQAWSAAMVLLPAVEGLWGIVPDAMNASLHIGPFLPARWNGMSLRRLRVGPSVLDIEVRRGTGRLVFRVFRRFGPALQVRLAPRGLPRVLSVHVDEIQLGNPVVQFEAREHHEVIYTF